MNWSLLLSDILARLIGLLGLAATFVYLIGTIDGLLGASPFLMLYGGLFLFTLFVSTTFLFPRVHDLVMAHTRRAWLRLPFILLCLIWVSAVGVAFVGLSQGISAATAMAHLEWSWAVGTGGLAIAMGIVVFPVGLGYRAPILEETPVTDP